MKKQLIAGHMSGHYTFIASRPDGSQRKFEFENLILDQGLDRIGLGGVFNCCQVGSGSTAPVFGNTGLQTLVATKVSPETSVAGSQDSAPYFGWLRQRYRFAEGDAAGNLREVGIGWGSSGQLFSRALIKDGAGDPTVITVLSDEVLDVTYEIRLYPPLVDQEFSVTIGGVTHDCVLRAANVIGPGWQPVALASDGSSDGCTVNPKAGPLGTIEQWSAGATGEEGDVTFEAYVNGTYKRVCLAEFNVEQGNVSGGIGAVDIVSAFAGSYQCSFDPPIMKDDTNVLSLSFDISWNRYTP